MAKSAEAFRTISEVAELLDTPAHVLRFWESRFQQIKPVKRAGGRRYYRPADVALIGGIKRLLHEDGVTIRGVQKILKEQGIRHVAALAGEVHAAGAETESDHPELPAAAVADLTPPAQGEAKDVLRGVLAAIRSDKDDEEPDEAPIDLDAPPMPLGPADIIRGFPRAGMAAERPSPPDPAKAAEAAETPAEPEEAGLPAVMLLRAMDKLRAAENRDGLTEIYDRLSDLRHRMAGGTDRPRS